VDRLSEAPASVEFDRFTILPHRREVLADRPFSRMRWTAFFGHERYT
jgi:hypothetical protein